MNHMNSGKKNFTDDSDDFALMKNIKMEPDTLLGEDDDLMAQLQQESSDLEVEPSFSLDSVGDDFYDGILMQHMDITQPLSTLKNLLEQKLGVELTDYSFWLQDSTMLENHKNLVDQCIQGKGLVQINVQIKAIQKRINIVDVLKPAEESDITDDHPQETVENNPDTTPKDAEQKVIRWIVDSQYKQEQQRLKIPSDPNNWTKTHVQHWLQWAVRQFNLASIRLADWNITGSQLCNLTIEEFQLKVPFDPGDVFWTHLELIKKCKLVAVVQKDTNFEENATEKLQKIRNQKIHKNRVALTQHAKLMNNAPAAASLTETTSPVPLNSSNRSINTGQIQLWQFLLELLTDKEHRDAIRWVGTEGEFKLNKPEKVAQLWGARKKKPSMNYEKLSRALRYYYDGDMISKVHGKRFVYKFVCDLKQLLGYSAAELGSLVGDGQRYYC